jgi:hypothetical protein
MQHPKVKFFKDFKLLLARKLSIKDCTRFEVLKLILVFWDATRLLYPDDGGSRFLRSIGIYLSNATSSHPRRL